jgi:acyl-CoA synthetase (AMP-forming)/AMP-acid ligase II
VISQHLHERLDRFGDQLAAIRGDRRETYRSVARRSDALARRWQALAGKRVGLCVGDPFAFIAAVAALDRLDAHVFLAGRRSEEELARLASTFQWDARVSDDDVENAPERADASAEPSGLPSGGGRSLATILTSGTSGIPKAANHTWATLAGFIRRDDRYAGVRWLCAYPLNFYAGLQTFLQAFLTNATLVIPVALNPAEIAAAMQRESVEYASGTPTFWRWLLAFAPRETMQASPLKQITLGGEIATQDVLDGLKLAFPNARTVHVYGLTETGRLFSVDDGREGFPTRFLEESPRPGVELRIVDGQLHARSTRAAMLGYDGQAVLCDQNDGWFDTGDVVEVRGDRVLFRGRNTDVINVGGRKVMPADVEAVLRSIPGIAEVRVYGRRSSLAGQLVAADLVLAEGADAEAVRAAAERVARERLASYQVPRSIQVVSEIARNEVFKILRREIRA